MRRILAKLCDYSLFVLPILTFAPKGYFYLILALVPIYEAICLTKWGTTLGKALFGIAIERLDRRFLPFFRALTFSLGVHRRCTVSVAHRYQSAKKSVFALLMLGVLSLGLASHGWNRLSEPVQIEIANWMRFTSAKSGFEVSFPTEPVETNQKFSIPGSSKQLNYKEFKSEIAERATFRVGHIDVPKLWTTFASTKRLLNESLEALVEYTEGAELLSQRFAVDSYGARVLDFKMKVGDEERMGRLLCRGTRIFHVSVDSTDLNEYVMNPEDFINSLILKA